MGRKRGKKTRRSRYGKDQLDYSTPLIIIGVLIFIIFAPVLIMFFITVYKDPASPDVARAIWFWFKDKTTGYLSVSSSNNNINKKDE